MDFGLLVVGLCANILLGWFLLLINVTSASTSVSSSEVELYSSSLNRGADDRDGCELEDGDAGRGIWGVKGLCGPGGSIGAGVSILPTGLASGDSVGNWGIWVSICCC